MKKLGHIESLEHDLTHSPFIPENIRNNDDISASVRIGAEWQPMRVWSYSPFGIEIIFPKDIEISAGDTFSIRVKFIADEISYESIKVSSTVDRKNGRIVGFRLFSKREAVTIEHDRRKKTRWLCSESYLPTGTAPNPLRFNDHIIFRVEDISAGGVRLVTSMRNKLLHKGQYLECSISIPLVGNVSATLKIQYIDVVERSEGKAFVLIGTSFVKPDSFLLKCLAEYLLHFGQDVTVNSLAKDGFPLVTSLKTFDFTYVKTKWEYEQVLSLRRKAYLSVGKITDSVSTEDMKDVFDTRSRILVVKKDDQVIGSVRVMFHDKFEDSELFKDGVVSLGELSDDEVVEASRLCTDPDFRGADIAHTLLTHMYLTAIKSGKRYIYAGATGSLREFYRGVGWSILEQQYECASLKGIPHNVILIDLHEVVLGRTVSGKVWRRLYKSLFEYLYEREVIQPSQMDLIRIRLYSLFA